MTACSLAGRLAKSLVTIRKKLRITRLRRPTVSSQSTCQKLNQEVPLTNILTLMFLTSMAGRVIMKFSWTVTQATLLGDR